MHTNDAIAAIIERGGPAPPEPARSASRPRVSAEARAEWSGGDGARLAGQGELAGLRPALELLDRRLEEALADAERRFGSDAASNPYRGLYLAHEDVARSLSRPAGGAAYPPRRREEVDTLGRSSPLLVRLGDELELSTFELAIVLIAVAPEVDLRYERSYALLHDDVTRRRPSLELALDLLCDSADEKLHRRRHFSADAPLLRSGLLTLVGDSARPDAPLLSMELSLAGPASGFLLGGPGPDPRLGPILLPDPPRDAFPSPTAPHRRRLARVARRAREDGAPLRLCFRGPPGCGRHTAAVELAAAAGTRLLGLNLADAPVEEAAIDRLLSHALLEARLRGWAVYLADADRIAGRWGEAVAGRLLSSLARSRGMVILASSRDWRAPEGELRDLVTADFSPPPFRRRRAAWRRALTRVGLDVSPHTSAVLAERFELTPLQVSGAVAMTRATAAHDADPTRVAEALFSAARAQAGQSLGTQARRIQPVFGFDDLVLPVDGKRQLREICQRVEQRRRVMEEWGFGSRLPMGAGINALFAGPSGTGKTMAAQVVAGSLGLDLYRIDLSQIVSKYIGETEKNLGRIFDQAESSNAILFFDEADALFGKRSEVKDSHDRYANIEIGYLLQKMEEYSGVTILATNFRQNMDDAFVRRLAFHVHFPLPDEADRTRIWRGVLPHRVPLGDDVDFEYLGHRFKLTGGNIRNVALAAAFLAAEEHVAVSMRHFILGLRREFQKMGKVCVENDFAPYFPLLSEANAEKPA